MAVIILCFIALLCIVGCLAAFYQVKRLQLERTILQIKCLFYRLR